ncbi:MAG: hypothetical protein EXR92_00235 [Gemmatimonadetes bacterium]|nr:hypothetical protein [Gemmatimonadota bacterium]
MEQTLPPGSGGEAGALAHAPDARELVFDREFLFISIASDPVVAIPWFFRARSQVGGVLRERSAWIQRGGTWEALVQESELGPTSRTPWRILPGENLRLIIGEDDDVEALFLRDGAVELETRLVDFLAEWMRQVGDPVRLFAGRSLSPSGPIEGYVLDLPRSWEAPGEASGDWIFLLSGTDLQLFLEEVPSPSESRIPTRYRGWSRSRLGDGEWSSLTVLWENMRPFERARRNIPSRWGISSPGGEISGELVSVNSYLSAGEGEGPILPVSGLFGVTGTLRIQGNMVSVAGVVRHVQR